MEIEMKYLFIAVLFLSLIFIRLRAEYKKKGHTTLTSFLKRITKLEIHHIHFGILWVIITSIWIYFAGINLVNLAGLAIGVSFIADEIVFAIIYLKIKKENIYYTKRSLIISIILHIIISVIVYFLF
jgi:hypothetical protein